MLKYAVVFLIISLIAGAVGLTNLSALAKRISMILFALFFLGFLVLLGFFLLLERAVAERLPAPPSAMVRVACAVDTDLIAL